MSRFDVEFNDEGFPSFSDKELSANDFICSDDVNVDGSDYERASTSKTNGDTQ